MDEREYISFIVRWFENNSRDKPSTNCDKGCWAVSDFQQLQRPLQDLRRTDDILNHYGAHGYELVTVTPEYWNRRDNETTSVSQYRVFFEKRHQPPLASRSQ